MQPAMPQPVVGQPMMGQPVVQPVSAMYPQPAPQPALGGPGSGPPPGAPPGGQWIEQQHCGEQTCMATLIVAILFWPATCCIPACKCDRRLVYQTTDGRLLLQNGAQAPPDCC